MDIDDYYRLFLVPGMNHWCVSPLPSFPFIFPFLSDPSVTLI